MIDPDEDVLTEVVQAPKKRTPASTVQRWTEDELKELRNYLSENIKTGVTPGKKACMKAIRKSQAAKGVLHKRGWETIKKKVCYIIQKEFVKVVVHEMVF